jgi:hypothetical protein
LRDVVSLRWRVRRRFLVSRERLTMPNRRQMPSRFHPSPGVVELVGATGVPLGRGKEDAQQQPELQYQPWLTLHKSNVNAVVVVGRYASIAKAAVSSIKAPRAS